MNEKISIGKSRIELAKDAIIGIIDGLTLYDWLAKKLKKSIF